MSDSIRLTRPARKLLILLYDHYATRVRYGTSMDEARIFGGSCRIISRLSLSDSPANVTSLARELASFGLISAFFANNDLVESELNPSGIAFCESRYDDLVKLLPGALSLAVDVCSLFK